MKELLRATRISLPRGWTPLWIGVLTFAAFLPSLGNGFVAGWDDGDMFLNNPHYRGLGWKNIQWMFTTFHMGPYQPFSWLTLGLDYLVWGLDPFGYHLTNLLLHTLNGVIFYWVAFLLFCFSISGDWSSGDWSRVEKELRWGAAFVALFFALHPLRVESVVWVTERRDVLSGFFFLLTLLFYLQRCCLDWDRRRERKFLYALSLVAYTFSLLSKAIGMTLPLILFLLDLYPLRRLQAAAGARSPEPLRSVLLEKLPYGLLAVSIAVVAVLGQVKERAVVPLEELGLWERVVQSAYGLCFYLWKTGAPLRLSPLYERPLSIHLAEPRFLASVLVVIFITVGAAVMRKRWPQGLVAWAGYVILLLPVIGLLQVGKQIAADRYSYLASLPLAVLAGSGLMALGRSSFHGKALGDPSRLRSLIALSVLAILLALTFRQTAIWRDNETLWRHAVQLAPRSVNALINLGGEYLVQRRFDEASQCLRQANQLQSAAPGHYLLANVLVEQSRREEAVGHYQEALRLDPQNIGIRMNLGNLFSQLGRYGEATAQYQGILQKDRANAEAYNNLGLNLFLQNRIEEAIEKYLLAIRYRPGAVQAYHNLARARARQGRFGESIGWLRRGIRKNPGDLHLYQALAWLWATCPEQAHRDGAAAVELAERLAQERGSALNLDILAAAYAEAGRFEEARQVARKALQLALSEGLAQLADRIRRHYQSYQRNEPLHEAF